MEPAIHERWFAVHERMRDARTKGDAGKRRPAALGVNRLGVYGGSGIGVDHGQIRPIALAQVAALLNIEQLRRCVRSFLHDLLDGELAGLDVFKQREQRVLHKRQSGGGVEIPLRLFLPSMRRVIGCDDIDAVFRDRAF